MSETILREAERIIAGDREDDYGSAAVSFARIAGLWSAYLGVDLTAHDVANLMILMKVSRAKKGYHRDSYVDIAGYSALSEQLEAGVVSVSNSHVFNVGDVDAVLAQIDDLLTVPQVAMDWRVFPTGARFTDRDRDEYVRLDDGARWSDGTRALAIVEHTEDYAPYTLVGGV